jgi:methylmalonyl-CoA mutase cobalamin-binding domain/chain
MIESMEPPESLLAALADAVVGLKPAEVGVLARRWLDMKLPPDQAITDGLARGMKQVGEKFAAREYFVPEVLLASRAMYAGFDILQAELDSDRESRGRIALGVVQGDIHDIGKNIVKVMVQAAGFEVVDLGRNVSVDAFVRAADQGVGVVGMSSLMTTTMPNMARIIEALDKAGLRGKTRVIIGGAPVNARFCEQVGADAWAPDAHSAVIEIENLAPCRA